MGYFYGVGSAVANLQELDEKGVANGYASLDSNGRVPSTQLFGSDAASIALKPRATAAENVALIQAALNLGGDVLLDDGTFNLNYSLTMPSGTTLRGSGWNTKLVFSVVDNVTGSTTHGPGAAIRASADNNTNMVVRDLMMDTSALAVGNKCIAFYLTQHTRVENVRMIASGQGVIHVNCGNYWVQGCHITCTDDLGDGLIDQWWGSNNGHILNNIVDCAGIGKYGILLTGSTTALAPTDSFRMEFRGNLVKNTVQPGIYMQFERGTGKDLIVADNIVEDAAGYGIVLEGDLTASQLTGNIVRDSGSNGIRVRRQTATLGPRKNVIANNTVINANLLGGAADAGSAIALASGANATENIIDSNQVIGTSHVYALLIDAGSNNNSAQGNRFDAGTATPATVNDLGTGNYIADRQGTGTYTPTLTNIANIDASVAAVCHWVRTGRNARVWGTLQIDPTAGASTTTTVDISLPIASNFTLSSDCVGIGFGAASTQVAQIVPETTNDRAQLTFLATDTANRTWHFAFDYEVKGI